MASSSAGNKPGAVHYFLIAFVLLSVILGATTFMYSREDLETENALAKATKDLADEKRLTTKYEQQIAQLKGLIGHGFEAIGTPGERNNTTVIGSGETDIASAGDVTPATMSGAIKKLVEERNQLVATRDQLQADIAALNTKVLALEGQYNERTKQQTDAASTAERNLQDTRQTSSEQLAQKDKDFEQMKTAYNDVQNELTQEKERATKQAKELTQRISDLDKINLKLKEQLDQLTNDTFEVPDAVVRHVDNVSRLVWITVGEADNLPVRTSFSVYTQDNHGVARGSNDIKGAIEVTRMLGPHLAEARILQDNIYDPISPGDPIYTPLWSPGQGQNFAFIGKIDLDNDGKDDRELLYDIVHTAHAKVWSDVGLDGVRKGEKIDVNTKFFVIGEVPEPGSTNRAEELKVIDDINNHRKDMYGEAQVAGVKVISLSDFKSYIGYKPQRQLYKPGEKTPYTLKAGARSTATKEPIGGSSRVSGGQTSGATRAKTQIKPKSSSGQVSKTFGAGY